MAVIRLDSISLAYGGRHLFKETSLQLERGGCTGIVGANGAGKSTLLKLISGELAPDSGNIETARGTSIGVLAQEAVIDLGRPIVEVTADGAAVLAETGRKLEAARDTLARAARGSEEEAAAVHAVGELETAWEAMGGYRLRAEAEAVLLGLGFSVAELERPGSVFSGGWRMRVALARLLLGKPDYLLLDEPTNHLDMDSLRWLERFLKDYPGALLLVSHDRWFLDRLCTRILHLDNARVDSYTGNYTEFARARRVRREALGQAARNQEKQIAQTERFIERFRYKASKARQVQSRVKALAKVERIELDPDDDTFSFAFPPPPRGGEEVLCMEGIHKHYGDKRVLEGVDITLRRGERVALVGVNGAGKSTLCRIAAGQIEATAGTTALGYRIEAGFFAQEQSETLEPSLTVLQTLEAVAPAAYPIPLRTLLGGFLFRGDDVDKRVGVLSGGEKNRLALCRMLVRPANLLILDEPTNHLDMRAKEVLQQALLGYEGTLLVVSHDRAFLDPLVEKVIEIGHGKVRHLPGTLSDYLARKDEEDRVRESAARSNGSAQPPGERVRRRKDRAETRRRLAPLRTDAARLERRVTELEEHIAALERAMADPETYRDAEAAKARAEDHAESKQELDEALSAWEAAHAEIDQLTAEGDS